jgi:C4-type Zn-finger protein
MTWEKDELINALASCQRDLATCAGQREAANARIAELESAMPMAGHTWCKKELLDAANARIAELEGLTEVIEDQGQLRAALIAANARAEAAEHRRGQALTMCEERERMLKAAESEAASLRAEHDRIWGALEHPAARYAPMIGSPDHYMGMAANPDGAWCRCEDIKILVAVGKLAQSEAASLRAELERAQQSEDRMRVEAEQDEALKRLQNQHAELQRANARAERAERKVLALTDSVAIRDAEAAALRAEVARLEGQLHEAEMERKL